MKLVQLYQHIVSSLPNQAVKRWPSVGTVRSWTTAINSDRCFSFKCQFFDDIIWNSEAICHMCGTVRVNRISKDFLITYRICVFWPFTFLVIGGGVTFGLFFLTLLVILVGVVILAFVLNRWNSWAFLHFGMVTSSYFLVTSQSPAHSQKSFIVTVTVWPWTVTSKNFAAAPWFQLDLWVKFSSKARYNEGLVRCNIILAIPLIL